MSARQLGLLRDTVLLNLGRNAPFRVTLMVSEECPLRCATCGIWKRDEPRAPRLEDLERFFRANRSLSWINLTGCEIFMRPDTAELFGLIAAALPRLALLNFPTSGQHPERIAASVEEGRAAGIEKIAVSVSFDGGSGSHDTLRGRPGAFETARRTFTALREISARSKGRLDVYPGLTLSAELLRLSTSPLDDLARELELRDIGEIHVNVAHVSDHYYANSRLQPLPRRDLEAVLGKARAARKPARSGRGDSWIDLLERIYLGCAPRYLASGRSPLPCRALRASVFVDAGLDVYPCTIFNRPVGSLVEAGFALDRLRAGADWRKARAAIDGGACPGCWTPCEAYPAVLGNLLRPGIATIIRAALARTIPNGREQP